jgi:hypothetical protein
MANSLKLDLTIGPKEAQAVSEFIMARTIASEAIEGYATVYDGISMNTQLVISGNLGLTGLKNASCGRNFSGAESTLSERFLNPVAISDTLSLCGGDIDAEFKAYKNPIKTYKELYDFTGSDIELLLAAKVEEAIQPTLDRVIWASDTAITGATSGATGLISGVDAAFYNTTDGLWKQFQSTGITRVTIAKNAATTASGQTLAAGDAKVILDSMLAKGSVQLRQAKDKHFLVSGEIFDNMVDYLISVGNASSIEYSVEGIPTVKYKGIKIVNMEGTFVSFQNVIQNTVTNLPANPHKVILTTPSNIAIGTLDKGGISEVSSHYEWTTNINYVYYGFTVGAIVLEDSMAVVAY